LSFNTLFVLITLLKVQQLVKVFSTTVPLNTDLTITDIVLKFAVRYWQNLIGNVVFNFFCHIYLPF